MRKNIVSDAIETLCDVCTELCEKRFLHKIVLSKPLISDEIKSVVSLKLISGASVIQVETYSTDNKVYHQNVKNDIRPFFRDLFYRYNQINVMSSVGDCQYMMSKKGKETMIGCHKIQNGLKNGRGQEVQLQKNNKTKNYILLGGEDFLKKLGVSDDSGRVRDRMQSKFRQINKFLEYVDSIVDKLPEDNINIYDLCCGKSYLSFAVYHYFRYYKKKNIKMVCIDLKADVIEYCSNLAVRMGFDGMEFICMDINEYDMVNKPDLVVSLHACDIATDIVLNKASENGAKVILSTPCCHHELNHKINCQPLSFITDHSMLRQKLCDAATDALRILKLESEGYEATAMELIDPEDTPKNIIIKAIKKANPSHEKMVMLREKYLYTRKFLLGE
ncbi:MAG: SAM-dependent methyltransferase [Clostridia bacterium]|nr:SAM-dependent methyltransferase [Clostridia bacterium]